MVIREIKEYAQIRTKARAYLCYLMGRTLSNVNLEGNIEEQLTKQLKKLQKVIPNAEVLYALDANGIQVVDNISSQKELNGKRKGYDRSDRAYFYRTFREHRCVLTEPYPSLESNSMVVTASFPIYDENHNLMYIVCVDIQLDKLLSIILPSSVDSLFGRYSKFVYSLFSLALVLVAFLLFIKGVSGLLVLGWDINSMNINEMFKSTILLTLSLAIFDLVKAIFEEEVLGKEKKDGAGDGHQTMIRFLGSIIIALSIESLMLVFKFAITKPEKLHSAVDLIYGVTVLIVGLSVYIWVNKSNKNK